MQVTKQLEHFACVYKTISMKQAEIKKELHQHFKNADHLYNDMLEEFELEVVHDFRVEIKKIRAFMRLLNTGVVKDKRIKLSDRHE